MNLSFIHPLPFKNICREREIIQNFSNNSIYLYIFFFLTQLLGLQVLILVFALCGFELLRLQRVMMIPREVAMSA